MNVLVTGAAGFIGFHLSRRLLNLGHVVVGLDNLNDYYSVELKRDRLDQLKSCEDFKFTCLDLDEVDGMAEVFKAHTITHVVHLAAQAGVRYSIENPRVYIESNASGFLNVLEGCRHNDIRHLVFASSSSVYGLNTGSPFDTRQNVDHPISLYGATKKANELMAHAYSHLYEIPSTGLRFFSVYGPWGRPDMAAFLFTEAILEGRPINVFNRGKMRRSFTYIDDIVEGVVRVMDRIPAPRPDWSDEGDPSSSSAPYKIYNIGNDTSVELGRMIAVLEGLLGREAEKNYLPMQPGDVPDNSANVDDLKRDVGFSPSISIEYGLEQFVAWYRDYYRV